MQKLAIIGSGDLGQLIAYHAIHDHHYNVVGFFDDYKVAGTIVNGLPVLGTLNDLLPYHKAGKFDVLLLAIGYKHFTKRKECFEMFKEKVPFGKIIHSSVYVADTAIIGDGTFILPGCILDHNVEIEENVLINTGSCVAHDSKIGSHSFLSPRVAIAGFVKIGSCCNIGINTTIIDNITIVDNVQTGGGTVVIKSLQTAGLYVGNPAKFIR
jgi:sugar O-acyltransferase (sialic acid O-acetyltransferase NeuD family)